MTEIVVESPGLLTTVQDCGRFGYQRFGMPVAGAMDVFALQAANILVGNDAGAAALEATIAGPTLYFPKKSLIAICGADLQPMLNGRPIPLWETVRVGRRSRLAFGGLRSGCRAYIAFAGGIATPPVMGSRSVYQRAGIGAALREGERLMIGKAGRWGSLKRLPPELIPVYDREASVRIIPGPEATRMDFENVRLFLTSVFEVTPQSDRMGLRLHGPAISFSNSSHEIVSAGIAPGTVQLPASGQLIVMLADRQTTGGYARIAHVASVDLELLAQVRPGDRLRFRETTIEIAQRELRARRERLAFLAGEWR
jgi:antagonist of KipI